MATEVQGPKQSTEQRYFDALKRITLYMEPRKLRSQSEKLYGLGGDEAIEMAYENILNDARLAVKGKRRPTQ